MTKPFLLLFSFKYGLYVYPPYDRPYLIPGTRYSRETLPVRRVGESLKTPRQMMVRVGNLGGISSLGMLLRARVALLADTGTPGSYWIAFLNLFTPMSGSCSVWPSPVGRSHIDARAFPSEQFAYSKSAWVTRYTSRTDFLARTSAVQAEDTTRESLQELTTDPASFSVDRQPRSTSTSSVAHRFPRGPVPMAGCQKGPHNSRTKFFRAAKHRAAPCGHGTRPSEAKGRRELRV